MSTVVPASLTPLSVDYTTRDYYSLREQLIARIQDRIPQWTASDPSDFGVALVEAFSYMGDIINYYIDRVANENLITTATQRGSLLALAAQYGYTPAGYRAASLDLTFTNSSETDQVLPAGTEVSGTLTINDVQEQVIFTTDSEVIVPQAVNGIPGVTTVSATQGQEVVNVIGDDPAGDFLGTSDGTPEQTFELNELPVVDDSVSILVEVGGVLSRWDRVEHLMDYGPYDTVYSLTVDANDVVYVIFGDGVSGAIPARDSAVYANYRVGGGIFGNIAAGTIDNVDYIPGLTPTATSAVNSYISVTNLASAVGGSDPESDALIRKLAPAALRAQRRAVTLADFNDLSLSVTGVGKANSIASSWSSVTVYVAPSRNDGDQDTHPGLDNSGAATTELVNLQADVQTYLADRTLVGTSVTVAKPVYIPLSVKVTYTKKPQYVASEIETAIQSAILTAFAYNQTSFADTITPQQVEFVLQQVSGVQSARVTILRRTTDTTATTADTMTGAANEIFTFSQAEITFE